MDSSKIHLSESELRLFCDEEVILTKNRIISTTIRLLQHLEKMMLDEGFTGDVFNVSPKITKGENYLGLPYVILDYPRKSDGESILFIRSMFWWGHFYSSTLHASGTYKKKLVASIHQLQKELADRQYHAGISEDPWIHHFENDNYVPIHQLSAQEFSNTVINNDHLKIAAHWPLDSWANADTNLFDSWKFLAGLIA